MQFPLLALAMISLTLAAPTTSNDTTAEVIPGDGLPSLASLNITSADLYDPDFLTKFGLPEDTDEDLAAVAAEGAGNCDVAMGKVKTSHARACHNYLKAAGHKECRVNHRPMKGDLFDATFCTAGKAAIGGVSVKKTSSYCSDVAKGVHWIIKHCAAKKKVHGQQAAYGNGNLIVGVGKKA